MVGGKERVMYVDACPCHRRFEDEQLCINEDPIKVIVTFDINKDLMMSEIVTESFTRGKEKDDLCFCLIYLDEEEDRYYCLSQDRRIQVQGNEVSGEEMQRALEMLVPENSQYEPDLCNECLYNVLVSMKENRKASCSV
ncbi:MAG: hypothetical protein ACFFF9_15875 [Candidatus Thorarchaeota archaeon]